MRRAIVATTRRANSSTETSPAYCIGAAGSSKVTFLAGLLVCHGIVIGDARLPNGRVDQLRQRSGESLNAKLFRKRTHPPLVQANSLHNAQSPQSRKLRREPNPAANALLTNSLSTNVRRSLTTYPAPSGRASARDGAIHAFAFDTPMGQVLCVVIFTWKANG